MKEQPDFRQEFGRLQDKLNSDNIRVIEEGLCGRTTVFEDACRENRNGYKTLPLILETHSPIDFVVLMLGTNDCKAHYHVNAHEIGKGLEQCIDKISEFVPAERILIVSPIHLGELVWKEEFDKISVETSKQLAEEYRKIATKRKTHFLDASEFAAPSEVDQEHMSEAAHCKLAEAIYRKIIEEI